MSASQEQVLVRNGHRIVSHATANVNGSSKAPPTVRVHCLTSHCYAFPRARKKTNEHKHFGRDGVRDKQEPSLGQMGPLPGTKWDPSLGQTGLSLFYSTVKSPFRPVCPWDGWGFVPGTIVPQEGRQKMFMCFLFIGFFCSQFPRLARSHTVVSKMITPEILFFPN